MPWQHATSNPRHDKLLRCMKVGDYIKLIEVAKTEMKKYSPLSSFEGFLRLQRTMITTIPIMSRTPAAAAPAYIAVFIPLLSPVREPSSPIGSKKKHTRKERKSNVVKEIILVSNLFLLVSFSFFKAGFFSGFLFRLEDFIASAIVRFFFSIGSIQHFVIG